MRRALARRVLHTVAMTASQLIFTGAAAALLALLATDVFLTAFHPRGVGGPLNTLQNRLAWRIALRIGRITPRALRVAAPLMVVLTLASWFVILVVSFALAYYPWMETFLVSDGSLRAHWVEALYYSGYTAATLGFGDLVPGLQRFRLLAPIEAFLGFSLISVSVTYLLAVYRELLAMRTLALDIAVHFREGDEHFLALARTPAEQQTLATWCDSITSSLIRSLEAHFQYPILHYFRPADDRRALPVQISHILALRAALPLRPDSGVQMHGTLSFEALAAAAEEYLRTVESRFVPRRFTFEGESHDGDAALTAHERLLRYTGYR
jgi:hypothetical protein